MPRLILTDFLRNLTVALLSGDWTAEGLKERAGLACRGDRRCLPALLRRVLKKFGATAPSARTLYFFLRDDKPLYNARSGRLIDVGQLFWLPATMTPAGPAWNVPALTTVGQLADWLGISSMKLARLANVSGSTLRGGDRMRHYVCTWQRRRRGSPRLLEAPKSELKAIQRHILDGLLAHIPPHDAAHGFRAGRSIVTYATPHLGKCIVLRFDLRDFFGSLAAARVRGVFRAAGYPEPVALMLAALCTTRTPAEVWDRWPDPYRDIDQEMKNRYGRRHLPQGAPTSPALANLCAYRLDLRLEGLARKLGASYTRYADDLAFSGGIELERAAKRFQVRVAVIAAEEGFALNFRKSRFMRQALRQQLASVVVNVKPNVKREAYDQLKAILTNCVRHGPESQTERRISIFGRTSWGASATWGCCILSAAKN